MTLAASIARGRELAALLDLGNRRSPALPPASSARRLPVIAVPATRNEPQHVRRRFCPDGRLGALRGRPGSDAGAGSRGGAGVYAGSERDPPWAPAVETLGETTLRHLHLNDNAYWRNIPANVWNYRLGGYQVLKKWLSYRERKVLGRELKTEEVGYFSETARRITAILLTTSGT